MSSPWGAFPSKHSKIIFFFTLSFSYVACVLGYVQVHANALGTPQRVSEPLKMEMQPVVSHQIMSAGNRMN